MCVLVLQKKITFVTQRADAVRVQLIELDHLINKAKLEESDKFEDHVTPCSRYGLACTQSPAVLLSGCCAICVIFVTVSYTYLCVCAVYFWYFAFLWCM
jgi:hypothetical protein